jgi:hypothetical protein
VQSHKVLCNALEVGIHPGTMAILKQSDYHKSSEQKKRSTEEYKYVAYLLVILSKELFIDLITSLCNLDYIMLHKNAERLACWPEQQTIITA